jgi:hypothetical protein
LRPFVVGAANLVKILELGFSPRKFAEGLTFRFAEEYQSQKQSSAPAASKNIGVNKLRKPRFRSPRAR